MTVPACDASVIVCTYDRAERLRRTLTRLVAQQLEDPQRVELIVVDNNSADHTRAVVESFHKHAPMPLRYAFEPTQGKTHALNRGVAMAQGQWVLFTDDDVIPGERWITTMCHAFTRHQADGVCGRIEPLWDIDEPPRWVKQFGDGPLALVDYGERAFVISERRHWFAGANMAIRRDVLREVGTFREDLGPNGRQPLRGDDTELFERLLAAGKRLIYEPASVVKHEVTKDRLTRRYFRHWNYWSGYSMARYRAPSIPVKRLLCGLPRWTVREAMALGSHALAAYAGGRWTEGFGYELQWWRQVGYGRGIVERARPGNIRGGRTPRSRDTLGSRSLAQET